MTEAFDFLGNIDVLRRWLDFRVIVPKWGMIGDVDSSSSYLFALQHGSELLLRAGDRSDDSESSEGVEAPLGRAKLLEFVSGPPC